MFFFINCCAPGMLSKLVTVRMTLPGLYEVIKQD